MDIKSTFGKVHVTLDRAAAEGVRVLVGGGSHILLSPTEVQVAREPRMGARGGVLLCCLP